MDNLINETRKLSDALNAWDFTSVLRLFTKHAHEDPIQRRLLVLQEYFRTTSDTKAVTSEQDVQTIKRIFPNVERDYILNLLNIIGNEENRIRVVIKLLLNETSAPPKRNGDLLNEIVYESTPKKPKLSQEAVNIPTVSSIDSTSTIIYTPDDYVTMSGNGTDVAYTKMNGNSYLEQPSTSSKPDSLDTTSYNFPFLNQDTLDNQNEHNENISTNQIMTVDEIIPVDEDVDLVDSVELLEKEIRDTKKSHDFHLYRHLQGILPDVPLDLIKLACKEMRLNKYKMPPERTLNLLMLKLLAQNAVNETKKIIDKPVISSAVAPFNRLFDDTPTTSCKPILPPENDRNVPQNQDLIVLHLDEEESFKTSEQLQSLNSILHRLRQDKVKEEVQESAVDDNGLIYPLMEMFPQASPSYIREICRGKQNNPGVLDDLISQILETNYPLRTANQSPPRQLDFEEQLQIMKSILVDADPDYLQMHCERLIDKPEELKEFIAHAIETRNYPTLKDFLRRQQISAQQKQYTTEFSIEKFIEVIPQPFEYFNDPDRKINPLDYTGQHYALCYLRNKFPTIKLQRIRNSFFNHNDKFLPTCRELELLPSCKHMKSKRGKSPMPEAIQNIPLLQEIAFYDHEQEIREFLNKKRLEEEIERNQAKAAGLMQTCSCCFDDEVMPKNIYSCEYGCVFCKDCVKKGAEVAFSEGKLNFPCLSSCTSHFSLQVLQAVLTPKMFSKIALKKQVEEVKAAGIEELETCPFCDFATIPARDDKLFRCLNPECMKESCRACKEPSHVPLRCEEVEKDSDIKARTYIENKMTEALLRTCYKCGLKFIKADGCNKMTCSCGALMCYVCGQPVQDYKHFNGLGGDQIHLCPLYSDTNKLHRDAVLKGAEQAKQEIAVDTLKFDPTSDIQSHYRTNPNRLMEHVQPINPYLAIGRHERVLQQHALEVFRQMRVHRLQEAAGYRHHHYPPNHRRH